LIGLPSLLLSLVGGMCDRRGVLFLLYRLSCGGVCCFGWQAWWPAVFVPFGKNADWINQKNSQIARAFPCRLQRTRTEELERERRRRTPATTKEAPTTPLTEFLLIGLQNAGQPSAE
jgi:hypothetical protein